MSQTLTIMTTAGPITIMPDQFIGFRPCTVTDPKTGRTVPGSELIISAGAIPAPVPEAMRAMAGRFETHAQTVEDEARRMWASSQNISGAGWSGMSRTSQSSASASSAAVQVSSTGQYRAKRRSRRMDRLPASSYRR